MLQGSVLENSPVLRVLGLGFSPVPRIPERWQVCTCSASRALPKVCLFQLYTIYWGELCPLHSRAVDELEAKKG